MSAKQITLVTTTFLLAFLFGALLNVPAIQLFHFIQLPQNVAVAGVEGSLSKGRVSRLEVQGYPVSDLTFELKPTCFIKLAICYQAISDEDGIYLNLERSLLSASLQIYDSQVDIPNTVFTQIPNLLVKPGGTFSVKIAQLELNAAQKLEALSATVDWNKARIEGEKQVIGNYAAEVNSSSNGLDIKISDRDSLLGIQGSVNVSWKGQYETDLDLEHKPGLNPALVSVLDMSAQKSGLNQFRIRKKGVLPSNVLSRIGRFLPNSKR